MPWKVGNPGCACCDEETPPDPPCDTVVTVDVYGCPGRYNSASPSTANPANGATVEVVRASDDVVLASGTTNASGRAVITTPTATRPLAAYVRVPEWCNYGEYTSQEITLNCRPIALGLNLLADNDYYCCSCPHPLPPTGTLTCSKGAFTLANSDPILGRSCTYRGVVTFTGPVEVAPDVVECDCPGAQPSFDLVRFNVEDGTVSVPVAVTVFWDYDPFTLILMDPPTVTVTIDWMAKAGQTSCGGACDWAYGGGATAGGLISPPYAHVISKSTSMSCTGCGEVAADGEFPASFGYDFTPQTCDSTTSPTEEDFCSVTIDNPLAGAWSFDLS